MKVLRFNGLQSYEAVSKLQTELVRQKLANRESTPDHLLIMQHYPVITLGRRSHSQSFSSDIPIVRAPRGGQITYHGPGQLVIYPIMDLLRHRQSLQWYVDSLAEVMKLAVKSTFNLNCQYQSCPERIGLWRSETEKLGFIGIHAQRWITSHGFSINITPQSILGFKDIVPCGLGPEVKIVSCTDEEDESHVYRTSEAVIESFKTGFNVQIE